MIQEIQSLLINDSNASEIILFPAGYSVRQLPPVCSLIRNVILGGDDTSLLYKCAVSHEISSNIYRDFYFRDVVKFFDARFVEQDNIAYTSSSKRHEVVEGDPKDILVDTSGVSPSRVSVEREVVLPESYNFSNPGWDDLGGGLRVSFKNSPSGPYRIKVYRPILFDESSVAIGLRSIPGLIDAIFLAGEKNPDCLYLFNRFQDDVMRFICVCVCTYATLVK